MGSLRLPEEIIREIIVLVRTVPDSVFLAFPADGCPHWMHTGSSGAGTAACAVMLRVCKQWLRIGTPLVYRKACLCTTRHTRAVSALLKAHPHVERAVRCVHLEGGLGCEMHTLARRTPNAHTIYISGHKGVGESVAGLERSLPC
ncbi:hypothetical protein PsYK624_080070 [Phanerochaete sordida]|uniref:Uncharacterized protein n=1 Tax=Phanerochaete sordida TaxID=48140 RepID=A0A9P3LDU2_9APHY|nr:hypothetical protein PsYK624_080070 [Phanerochaete sordida]